MKNPCPKCQTPVEAGTACPVCARNQPGRKACPLCGASVSVEATKCPSCRGTIGSVPCPACKEAAPVDAAICPHCHTALKPAQPVLGSLTANQKLIHPSSPPKSPGVAALLSFIVFCIPLGHFYIGQTIKGLIWIGIAFVTGGLGSILAAVDAYQCARKLERGRPVGEMEFFPG